MTVIQITSQSVRLDILVIGIASPGLQGRTYPFALFAARIPTRELLT
jgi:hypothetical protein